VRPRPAGPLEAFVWHPFLTLLPVLLLVAGAIYFGLTRDAEYTAHARIKVGRDDVPAAVLQNAAYGNQVIALSYSRAIAAPPVIAGTARRASVSPSAVQSRVSATLVPESTLIDVQSKGSSSGAARRLANAGASSLIAYVAKLNYTNTAKRLLRDYRSAQSKVRMLQASLTRLRRRHGVSSTDIARAQLAIDASDLKASQLANNYRAETTSSETAGAHLELLAPAATAESDRTTVLEQMIVVALAAGLVLGFGIALLRVNWRVLKAHRA
jgi:capsular polysaccharide biosynthesis protein